MQKSPSKGATNSLKYLITQTGRLEIYKGSIVSVLLLHFGDSTKIIAFFSLREDM